MDVQSLTVSYQFHCNSVSRISRRVDHSISVVHIGALRVTRRTKQLIPCVKRSQIWLSINSCVASLIGQILPEEKVVILSTYELGKSWGINRRRFSQFSRQLLVSAFYHTLDGKSKTSSIKIENTVPRELKQKKSYLNITEDFNSFSTTVEEKAKWVFNKLKGKPLKKLA
ncbi:hypothetical protein OIU84_019477 [Salix udensis]|uniref:Uncharacterized protein n=1 Tax=Salix udensis TaxID=889485 RepID=A0AAD6KYZ2_9ROSI|nr:hypothetical protein OIU84_019477 [Salix udensis]